MEQRKDIFSILVTSNIVGFAERKSNNSFSHKFGYSDKVFSHNNNLYYLSKIASLKDKSSSGSLHTIMSDLTDSETSNSESLNSESLNSESLKSPMASINTFESTNTLNSHNIDGSTNTSSETITPQNSPKLTPETSPITSPITSSKQSECQSEYEKQIDEYNYSDDNNTIHIQRLKNVCEKVSVPIPFIVQSSSGERTFIISENKKFSLRANVSGDFYILTEYGQICWICNNSRFGDTNIYGQPILELSNHGEIIFSINGKTLFTSMKQAQSGCYNLVLTNNGELITERTQTIIVEINSFHRTLITKQVQSIIFRTKQIVY
jgi:hypothetical protein